MGTAAETWMITVCDRHGTPHHDRAITVNVSQARLADEAGISPGTVSGYLSDLERRGNLLSRRPLRFQLDTSPVSRRSGHASGQTADDPVDQARVLLAELLTDPDARRNPWAETVANAVRLLTSTPVPPSTASAADPRAISAVSRPSSAESATTLPENQSKTRQDKILSLSKSEDLTEQARANPADPRQPASHNPAEFSHSSATVGAWIARLQAGCAEHGLPAPGPLDPLVETFGHFDEHQVDRAITKVLSDVAVGKVHSPGGVLVAANRKPTTRLEYFGRPDDDDQVATAPSEPRDVEFVDYLDESGVLRVEVRP